MKMFNNGNGYNLSDIAAVTRSGSGFDSWAEMEPGGLSYYSYSVGAEMAGEPGGMELEVKLLTASILTIQKMELEESRMVQPMASMK